MWTKKRLFDLAVGIPMMLLAGPAMLVCALAIWLGSGRPVFYVSTRRVHGTRSIRLLKFRTMIRGADRIANRDTVPVDGQRFLNIATDSPLYTPMGRIVERFHLTELPQLLHVLRGQMSLIGNRPLPEDVIRSLRERYPFAEDRFLARAGLTGPVQLVGRDLIGDEERLRLEIEYCRQCLTAYSMRLDLAILGLTVLVALRLRPPALAEDVERFMQRYGAPLPVPAGGARRVEAGQPTP